MSATTADGEYPSWQPPELGLARAAIGALLLVVLIFGFIYWAIIVLPKPPAPVVIQVTQAQLTALPKPAPPPPPPPPPPKVVPPPKPLPLIAKPPPVESKIVVPTKPPPPVHHVIPRPIKRVVPTPPQPVTPLTPPTPPVAAAPAPRTDGIPVYESQMHSIIESNQNYPPALASLGISGTAVVRLVVSPDGTVISASILRSSGNSLIDQVALDHAKHAHLSAFNANMPGGNQAFAIPIEVDPPSD